MERQVPPVEYAEDIEKLIKNYEEAYKLILNKLIELVKTDGNEILKNQQASLYRQISFLLQELNINIQPQVRELIEKSFTSGQIETMLAIGSASSLTEARKNVKFSALGKSQVETLVADTMNDLLQMTNRTDEQIKQVVRETVGHHLRMNAIQQMGRRTTSQAIKRALEQRGFTPQHLTNLVREDAFMGVTDRSGRRWGLRTYVDMVTRTKMMQSSIEGTRTEALERGVDLAVISSHGAEDECRHFEGLVISMNGTTEGYLSYDEIKQTNKCFHPNCEHSVSPLRKIELLPPALQQKHQDKMNHIKSKGIGNLAKSDTAIERNRQETKVRMQKLRASRK
jgi:Phage minor capsid protein 2